MRQSWGRMQHPNDVMCMTIDQHSAEPQPRFKLRRYILPILAVLGLGIWTTDRVTFQGERTVYTIDCISGTWNGNVCSGELKAGIRIRYRALKNRGEVLFWELGSSQPSAKLTNCTIDSGRDWTCPESPDSAKSLTLAMTKGVPAQNPARPFHAVAKVSWMLIDLGIEFAYFVDQ